MEKQKNEIMIYEDKDGITKVNVKFINEDIWLTQNQLAEIYKTTQENISMHIRNIYKDNELSENSTNKKFLLVQKEGSRNVKRNIDHYNLDMIISLGYRVQSDVAVRFRIWATKRLHEYIQKGFTMDDERLKQGGNRYFRELLQRIRDIRSSERNFYQQVTDIYATSIDYDPRSKITKDFFATVQNKLHFAVHEHTAAELIYSRANSTKDNMGLTSWKNSPDGLIYKYDVVVAKNYLNEEELNKLNDLTNMFLVFAEDEAKERHIMTMNDWIKATDDLLKFRRKQVLKDSGKISHKQAIEKAECEYEKYRVIQDQKYISSMDEFYNKYLEESNKN